MSVQSKPKFSIFRREPITCTSFVLFLLHSSLTLSLIIVDLSVKHFYSIYCIMFCIYCPSTCVHISVNLFLLRQIDPEVTENNIICVTDSCCSSGAQRFDYNVFISFKLKMFISINFWIMDPLLVIQFGYFYYSSP